jgi:hypothetical protein
MRVLHHGPLVGEHLYVAPELAHVSKSKARLNVCVIAMEWRGRKNATKERVPEEVAGASTYLLPSG